MAKRLFTYPVGADDEADAVREMLEKNDIAYYDTPPGKWGFYNPSIWIVNEKDFGTARRLLTEQQREYASAARQQYQQETGYDPNAPFNQRLVFFIKHLRNRKGPLFLLLFVLFLFYLYLSLFFDLFT